MGRPFKFTAFVAVIVASVVLIAILVVNKLALVQISQVYPIPEHPRPPGWQVPTDPNTVARGAHLVGSVMGCIECHGDNLAGKTLVGDSRFGAVASANLTQQAHHLSDADFIRAVRFGLRGDGRALWLMPHDAYAAVGDHDLAAVIAYLRSLMPIKNSLPTNRLAAFGRWMVASGRVSLIRGRRSSQPNIVSDANPLDDTPSATAEYGAYLAHIGRCVSCHGANLRGGTPKGQRLDPPPPDLVAGDSAKWHESDFFRAMRDGRLPDGALVDESMPWRIFSGMTHEELHALWLHLTDLRQKLASHP